MPTNESNSFKPPGPTELSIADPDAVKAIYSSQAKVSKGPWYTILEPRVSLQMVRNKQEHARRRKVWDQGFSARGMESAPPGMTHMALELYSNDFSPA